MKVTCLALLVLPLGLLGPGQSRAQDAACESLSSFPCGYQLQDHALDRAPALFKLQARVAQAGAFIGEAKFTDLSVKLRAGTEVLCTESFKNVEIRSSLMNLEIGREIDCELDDVLASNSDVNVQLCYGSDGKSCLPEFPLASVASVVRATWVWTSERAHRADRAAQAHYTHRFTADRDLDERETLGTGYFDLETPTAAAAAQLYDETAFAAYQDSGFFLWTPVRNRQAATLNLVGKDDATDRLRAFDELVLASRLTRTLGSLEVAPATAAGLTVTGRGAHVTGDSGLTGDLLVLGAVTVDGTLAGAGNATLGAKLTVGAGLTLTSPGSALQVTGDSDLDGLLLVGGAASVSGGLEVTGDSSVGGLLLATGAGTSMTVAGGLEVLGITTAASVQVTGAAELTATLTAPSAAVAGDASAGTLSVGAEMSVAADTLFKGHVTFLGGTARPGNPPNLAYVQFADETRDLGLGGLMTLGGGATAGGTFTSEAQTLLGARFQLAGAPPANCDAAAQGMIYFDMTLGLLRICVGGLWKTLGGGGVGALCGNGFPQAGEACDDGNLAADDGCSPSCTLEVGFVCSGAPTVCTPVCGDGLVLGKEACDDANLVPTGDGCSDTCTVVPGWSCAGEPSVCQVVCGDGLVVAGEGCDDGNLVSGDGCSAACAVEAGWSCDGEDPSGCTPVPLAVAGYTGVAGPDLRSQGLALCGGAGPAQKAMSSKQWLTLCDGKGYGEVVFACSVGDDTTAELVSPAFPLAGVTMTDTVCDQWSGAALWPLQGEKVLVVDASGPACGSYQSGYQMLLHFGSQWACVGTNNTPGYLGQTGGRMWAFVRMP